MQLDQLKLELTRPTTTTATTSSMDTLVGSRWLSLVIGLNHFFQMFNIKSMNEPNLVLYGKIKTNLSPSHLTISSTIGKFIKKHGIPCDCSRKRIRKRIKRIRTLEWDVWNRNRSRMNETNEFHIGQKNLFFVVSGPKTMAGLNHSIENLKDLCKQVLQFT